MSSAFLDASFSSYTNFFCGYDYAFTYCIGETVLNYYLGKVSYKPKETRVSYSEIIININNNNNNNDDDDDDDDDDNDNDNDLEVAHPQSGS